MNPSCDASAFSRRRIVALSLVVGIAATAPMSIPAHATTPSTPGPASAWGSNWYGGLGTGGATLVTKSPLPVGTATDWAGSGFFNAHAMCARRTDRTLWCWGSNQSGELGQGDTVTRAYPTKVGTAVWLNASTSGHTCGVQSDATLWCWGAGFSGELGLGDNLPRLVPTWVGTASWSTVSSGTQQTCGVQSNGTLWCWGNILHGQLG